MAEILAKYRKQAYSIPEVCEITGLGRSTIYEVLRTGKLPAVKCGRRTIVLDEGLKGFVNSLPAATFTGSKEAT